MPNEPQIQERAARPYAAIPIEAPMREWGRVNALVPEVFGWLAEQGVPPAGPLFYRYRVAGDMDRPFRLEVGVPTPAPVTGDGRVIAGTIPAGRYATLLHQGHPDKLFGSITALLRWADERGLKWRNTREGDQEVWGGCFEYYLTDPAEEPDMDNWSIELAYLLA
ncbi:GyrI-like domain-containing protein [Thermomonospora cellulosilytica]|uniref:Effector-binding domain-containing protein n=1 Tax=Thermomonospora cellulosilytica TaxID=1411118 RepID=A0A7W3R7A7_9ACTN|nr:GyrI-like domain-containing protein [Thermomonospora cellulosilytica]MBA9002492.1 effector-binding domain-containing protein [Thermomonospora cellulosilytica]